MNSTPPSARSNVAPFIVMDMMREANRAESRGERIIHMEVGQPSSPPPQRVIEAAEAALRSDRIGYTEAFGLPALRERIARHYRDAYGLDIAPERVVVTTGSSGAFVLGFLTAFDHGARVALPVPGYPAYRNILSALGIEVVPIHTRAENRWTPTVEDLRQAAHGGPLAGLLIASPANPTGTMIERDALAALVGHCAETGAWLVSDEIYHRLTYGMDETCALAVSDEAIVINSFSKYYCMTGWRIGWMIVPPRLLRPIECLAQNLFISPPTLSQHAALAAFDATEELDRRRAQYAVNRELLLTELPGIGFEEFSPVDGAFYIYTNVSRFSNDSFDFAQKMLREAGVAATPGADFDDVDGAHYLRLSFAGSTDEMQEAVTRLKRWLG
ncbi:MAG: pyridoxal phosphate-dependent aminotransferase [Hyphomicrobiales bacterium]